MWRSFRFRILLAMLAIALASIGSLFAVSYQNAVETLENNYLRTNVKNAGVQITRFDEYMEDLYRSAVRAGADIDLKDAVTAYLALDRPSTDDVIVLSALLETICSSADALETVYLYLPEKQEMLTSDEWHQRRTDITAAAYPWTELPEGFAPVRFVDTMSGAPRIMYGYGKPVLEEGDQPLAVICAGMSEQTIRYTLMDSMDDQARYYLLDETGDALSLLSEDVVAAGELPAANKLSAGADTVFGTSGDWLYASVCASFSGMRLLWLTERSILRTELKDVQEQFFILLLIVVLLALALAWILARWLYRPVTGLTEAMGRVGGGDFSPCPEPKQPEEFRRLSHSFNEMIAEINGLIDDLVQERMAKAEAELRALQYQIQPHFMYNTLNSIKYEAILQGNTQVGEQLGAFIALLEASVSKKGTLQPLSEEVQLLENYVSLQRHRYLDCFTVAYDLTQESKGCYVPRLLLQPIVENAILHGMDVKRNDNHIRVAALVSNGSLWITVQDNGAGMTPQQLRTLLEPSGSDHRQFTGIGVANIRERLQLYYGQETTFQVYSTPGKGTKFVLTLPASYNEKEYSR